MPIRQDDNQPNRRFGIINIILIGVGALLLFSSLFPNQNMQIPRVPYSLFIDQVNDGEVKRAYITQEQIRYELNGAEEGAPSVLATTPIFDMDLPQRLESKGVEFAAAPPKKPNFFSTVLSWVVPPLIFILVLQFFARRSMGGGGAQLVAAEDANIKAILAFCPWIDPSVVSPSLLSHSAPILIFSGQIDVVAPPGTHADIHYNYTPSSTKKLKYEVFGGGHTIANTPLGGFGEVGRMGVSWLKKYLVNDSCYCPLLLDIPTTASDYETNIDCSTPNSVVDYKNNIESIKSLRSLISSLNIDMSKSNLIILSNVFI